MDARTKLSILLGMFWSLVLVEFGGLTKPGLPLIYPAILATGIVIDMEVTLGFLRSHRKEIYEDLKEDFESEEHE